MMLNLTKYVNRYVNSKVVFVIDLFLFMVSSAVVVLLLYFLTGQNLYAGKFAIWWICGSLAASIASMLFFSSYKVVIRHTSLRDIMKFIVIISVKEILLGIIVGISCTFNSTVVLALFVDLLFTLFLVLAARFGMIVIYDIYKDKVKDMRDRQRVLIYGTTEKSVAAITRFRESPHYRVYGFLSNDKYEKNLNISEYPVYVFNGNDSLEEVFKETSASAVIFATEAELRSADESGLIAFFASNGIKALIAPTVDDVSNGVPSRSIRQVNIEDLLGRPEIKISMDEIIENFKGKVVMVTGAAGSIGSELCRQLAGFGVHQLVLFDNAETPMHNLRLELEASFPELDFIPVIGSVRHKDRLDYAFRKWRPQVVFHAAAYKHVPLMEENPCEAVFANVYGSRLVADKCIEYDVEKMVMISTDKAVNPTNIMGCSKRLAEIYVQSLGLAIEKGEKEGRTKFVTTRFGNVLGSNGSVIPRFREQIAAGGPVTVTHPDITRFFMTIPEACRLVMEAATMSTGNQIFVFDMGRSVKIADMAKRMIELSGLKVGRDIEIKYTGLRPGEKLYEEVLANTENTVPTSHDRIRIAKVREYDYADAVKAVDDLAVLSKAVDIPEMVKLMKKIVPEFKSKNSRFEIYDK